MRIIIFLFWIVSVLGLQAQNDWHRAKVTGGNDLFNTIGSLGIPVEGEIKKGESLTSDFSNEQIARMREAGLTVEILISDVKQHYVNQNLDSNPRSMMNASCNELPDYQVPTHFNHGSMGGFLTLAELYAELDEMRTVFPTLISARQIVDPMTTSGGRQLNYVRISDNPDIDESEPEVMFLALTHAREPMAMQQEIFFMWYLLENYATNPEIQYLLQNTEVYFIPCVNPDGYEYNRSTNASGGGMWRKNRRNNGDGTYGVDLNRNYGYQWGLDDIGSSPNGYDETYRGTSAFSESETQAVRNFVQAHEFQLIQDYHTYSNVVLYPWGYIDQIAPDSLLFRTYSSYMTSENAFAYGTPNQCIGYNANGGSFDWYYGDQVSKNKIIAWGPEVGDPADGFWPAEALIDDICKLYIAENLYMVRFASKYAEAKDLSGINVSPVNLQIPISILRLGMDSPAAYTVALTALSGNTQVLNGPFVYSDLSLLETRIDTFDIDVVLSASQGEMLRYELTVDNGVYTHRDTLVKYFGDPVLAYQSDASSTTGWTGSGWGTTTSSFVSSPSSITDSPSGFYSNGTTSILTMTNSVSLLNASVAWLTFWAQWDVEDGYDYVLIEASNNNGSSWTPLCGNYTNPGSADQLAGEPLYDGVQSSWVNEYIDLSDYLGQSIKFRFRLVSDSYTTGDGFFFDDFEVNTIISTGLTEQALSTIQVFPNPASDRITLPFDSFDRCLIYDAVGRPVLSVFAGSNEIDVSSLSQGTYYIMVFRGNELSRSVFVKM